MGEAKRRKNTQVASWRSQIVLCYEQEPYLAFDVEPAMLELAIAAGNPPTDDDAAVRDWLIAKLNQLREDVALMRDHSDELLLNIGRREQMVCNTILIVQVLLTSKQQRLATAPAVVFNLLASQSLAEARSPGFEIWALAKPLTIEEIRAMSTTNYLYIMEGDTFVEKIPRPPAQHSKDRSRDRTCISIGAYWHNDQPGGIMLELNINRAAGQTSLETEMDTLDQLVIALAETQPSAKDIDEYLHYMAQQQPEKDPVDGFTVMATIAYAEEAGYLHSDEFNGMLYLYRIDADVFVDRKDQPPKPPPTI